MKRLIIILISLVFFSSCARKPIIKSTPRGNATEFHKEPNKYIPLIFGSYSSRGLDKVSEGRFIDSLGGGIGVFIFSQMSSQWIGHKNLYYYIDIETTPEYFGSPYPGKVYYTGSVNPGIFIRSYLPFLFKIYYGAGINLRGVNVHYDRWGIYGMVGLELCGISGSTTFIGHPGQSNWEQEYRLGFNVYRQYCIGK